MRAFTIVLSIFVTSLIGLAVLALAPLVEHARRESPDGRFLAIVRTEPLYSIIPVMPGQSGDKPGLMTLYRGRQPCGSVWLPMASFIADLRWDLDRQPRRAAIPAVATWNVDDCALEFVNGG
jgi:hypothetical protein